MESPEEVLFFFRIVVWESAVLQIFNATNKCIASTQTDDVQTSEPTEEANITLQEDSVGADSVPQRIGRPKYLRKQTFENEFTIRFVFESFIL